MNNNNFKENQIFLGFISSFSILSLPFIKFIKQNNKRKSPFDWLKIGRDMKKAIINYKINHERK